MTDIRHGERVFVRRSAHHPVPVYIAGQRTMEIHGDAVSVRWSGYYRDLRREGAIELVPDAEKAAQEATLLEKLAEVDDVGFSQICDDIKAEADATARLLDQHGSQLQAATCRAAALSRIGTLRERWLVASQPAAPEQ